MVATPPPARLDGFSRRAVHALLAGAAASAAQGPAAAVSAAATAVQPSSTLAAKVTDRVFLDIRIIQRYDVEVLEDAAIRGRLTFGLFGRDAPLGTKKFLEFVDGTSGQFAKSGGGPAYSSGSFFKINPGKSIEGGRINGLRLTEFAGTQEYEFLSRLLPLRPVLEVNNLRHDTRGLLTRAIFNPGPEFAITLTPSAELDASNEVIGVLEGAETSGGGLTGSDLLDMLEKLPFITGTSIEGEGTAANALFTAQKSLFFGVSKTIGDSRAEDRTGMLLRRVEITRCGRL